MNAVTGFLQFALIHSAASSSAEPPISPIRIIASVPRIFVEQFHAIEMGQSANEIVAAVQRQLRDLLTVDDAAEGGAFRLQHLRAAGDLDDFADRSDFHADIEAGDWPTSTRNVVSVNVRNPSRVATTLYVPGRKPGTL